MVAVGIAPPVIAVDITTPSMVLTTATRPYLTAMVATLEVAAVVEDVGDAEVVVDAEVAEAVEAAGVVEVNVMLFDCNLKT